MRKVLLLGVSMLFYNNSFSATIIWDGGGGDGLWETPSNWVGDIIPVTTDDVVLDNSIVLATYTVTLPSGLTSISINTLIINPSGGNNINLILPTLNMGNPGLIITGPADALIINNNGILRNSSGAGAGSGLEVVNNFRINNGGRYIHNTQRENAVIVSQLSNVAGTELGVFEYDVPAGSYTPSLSGRTYGTLSLSSLANSGTATYIGSGGANLNIFGDLIINAGVTFSISMSANLIVHRNYNQSNTSTFNIQNSNNNNLVQIAGDISSQGIITETGSGQPIIELNGSSNQSINILTNSILNNIDFRLNNSTGATLVSNLNLPYRYTILSGNLILNNNSLITPSINQLGIPSHATNHIVTNGNGVLTISSISTTPILFPIGPSIDSLSALTINMISGGPNSFSARVQKGINPTIAFPTFGINRTWVINSTGAIGPVVLGFQYASNDANPGALPQPQPMEMLFNNGSVWNIILQNLNPINSDPYWVVGGGPINTITATPFFYTLGKTGGYVLPLDYNITAQAQKLNNTGRISWKVFTTNNVSRFEVQRSTDNGVYQTIASITPSGQLLDYNFIDAALSKGVNLYRIKVTAQNGAILYSNTVAIINDSKGLLITSLAPNPVQNQTYLTISAAKAASAQFSVYDIMGKLVKQFQKNIGEGSTVLQLDMTDLAAGTYHIIALSAESRAVFRFSKQ